MSKANKVVTFNSPKVNLPKNKQIPAAVDNKALDAIINQGGSSPTDNEEHKNGSEAPAAEAAATTDSSKKVATTDRSTKHNVFIPADIKKRLIDVLTKLHPPRPGKVLPTMSIDQYLFNGFLKQLEADEKMIAEKDKTKR